MKKILSIFLIFTLILTFLPQKGFTENEKNEKIISVAQQYVGVPYIFGGSTPSGFDCSGFLYYVFKEVGITLPRTASEQYHVGEKISKSDLKVGDLVFFETYKPGPSHSGIYVGNRKFIHASSSNGISYSSVDDPYYWSSRYLGARRIVKEEKQVVLSALPAGQYHDVSEDHWGYTPIKWLGENGIINGYDQSLFLPSELLTRSQAAVVVASALGLDTTKQNIRFKDVPNNHWAVGQISAIASAGFLQGFNDDTFRPDEVLTREQVAVLFSRIYNIKINEANIIHFNDVKESYWAHYAIQQLTSNGIASGYNDHTYRPKQEVTRAEFAVFLYRALHMK